MEQQIAELLRQNQELIRALQIRDHSSSHKITVQFEKFDEENENFDSFIERFETYLDVQNVPIANRAKNEVISTYIAELRALATNCDYDKDVLNIMLRDVFVSGLRDKMILDRLFEEDNINLEKTLNIALAMEKAFKEANDIMGRGINSMQTFKKCMDKKSNFTKNRKKTLYCSRCTGFEPFALKGRVENEIDRLEREGIIEKVESSEWATPVVPVVKTDGSLRLCTDYSATLNPNLIVPQHPLPRLEKKFAIFGSKRGLPVLAATRLLHYALILQSFEFDIIFRKTIEHGNADFLSRLPKTSEQLEVKDDSTIFQMSQIEALPVTSNELRQETGKDIELGPLLKALREGKDLQGWEAQYTIEDGCIMYGQRKNIDKDIEEADCARYEADPTKAKVHYWEYPSMPWERIHVDFAGPIFEHTFFLIVDVHSKWLEVYPMKTTTTKKTIECLRDSFARFGLPRVLVSDNGSQFTSYEIQRFM
ncbi:transposon Tf2-6 polyprotein [Trichonephila clavata]|uniref:Transposon Tf2-6 polyprotein n=1 Tax=Trichonephila clavata TaxID=2740835 RepID=A0A8X6GVX2_TRICU|nr:transposon Tf2-6 polyprotein [Trichonephila clavata]